MKINPKAKSVGGQVRRDNKHYLHSFLSPLTANYKFLNPRLVLVHRVSLCIWSVRRGHKHYLHPSSPSQIQIIISTTGTHARSVAYHSVGEQSDGVRIEIDKKSMPFDSAMDVQHGLAFWLKRRRLFTREREREICRGFLIKLEVFMVTCNPLSLRFLPARSLHYQEKLSRWISLKLIKWWMSDEWRAQKRNVRNKNRRDRK